MFWHAAASGVSLPLPLTESGIKPWMRLVYEQPLHTALGVPSWPLDLTGIVLSFAFSHWECALAALAESQSPTKAYYHALRALHHAPTIIVESESAGRLCDSVTNLCRGGVLVPVPILWMREPITPRIPRMAHIHYLQETCPGMRKRNPKAKPSDIMKVVADQWQEMEPSKRSKYEQMANAERARWKDQVRAHAQQWYRVLSQEREIRAFHEGKIEHLTFTSTPSDVGEAIHGRQTLDRIRLLPSCFTESDFRRFDGEMLALDESTAFYPALSLQAVTVLLADRGPTFRLRCLRLLHGTCMKGLISLLTSPMEPLGDYESDDDDSGRAAKWESRISWRFSSSCFIENDVDCLRWVYSRLVPLEYDDDIRQSRLFDQSDFLDRHWKLMTFERREIWKLIARTWRLPGDWPQRIAQLLPGPTSATHN